MDLGINRVMVINTDMDIMLNNATSAPTSPIGGAFLSVQSL